MAFTKRTLINIPYSKIETLLDCVKAGVPIRVALDKARIPQFFYYKWLNIYNEYMSELEKSNNGLTDIKELEPIIYKNKKGEVSSMHFTPISIIEYIKEAYATWIISRQEIINIGNDGWQSSAWLLERRAKEEYSKEAQTTSESDKVPAIKIVYVDSNKQSTQERLKALEQEVKESINYVEDK